MGTKLNEYIYFGGHRLAVLPASGSPMYYAGDMLGSSRMIFSSATGQPCYDADFGPFGEERTYVSNCPNQNNYKFEGKERDTESQNDEFGARYYSWRYGRWLSADWSSVPVPVPYANLTNPQTLNLYSMVSDDPESFADLDGHTELALSGNVGNQPVKGCDSGDTTCVSPSTAPQPTDTAQQHSFWWKVGHALGFVQTEEEKKAQQQADAALAAQARAWEKAHPGKSYVAHILSLQLGLMPAAGLGLAGEAAEGGAVLQSGGSTISNASAKALNEFFGETLGSREWGRALEALKKLEGIANNVHGQLLSNGDFKVGGEIGNISQFIRGN